ncbi:DUF4349 domain-containing protein [Parasphingorhabdus halotolerans]|uniref:DUF4349 domain-containing protein n=1 Tax=Parasphingorhabdus halotolerans TaxID=2725558 RepID=A0A6H2DN08_9SPHN|nr:DUF4349 domain-containing protein [Parasphingorhabdus halotolerans]QJB69373.1 DUF4349 domain-containing protein [Parasphingorhabdus halotolerans]
MTRHLIITASLFALAACSSGSENSVEYDMAESEVMETAAVPAADITAEPAMLNQKQSGDAEESANSPSEIPVSIPQIAYSYQYGFRLPAAEIPKAQQAHVTLCEKRGPKTCRVLNMENSGGEGDYANGMLHLEVAAKEARNFGGQLATSIDEYGGSQIAASISGEDLSKLIVDTEARLRSRVLLSQRLTELLRTKNGTVAELVEAERAVTQVNEEIDQARSWLKEMRGRVAFSKIIVNYQSGAPGSGGFLRPIREAFGGIASMLGTSIAAVVTIAAALLPWIFILALGIYLRRRFKAKNRSFWGREIESYEEATATED